MQDDDDVLIGAAIAAITQDENYECNISTLKGIVESYSQSSKSPHVRVLVTVAARCHPAVLKHAQHDEICIRAFEILQVLVDDKNVNVVDVFGCSPLHYYTFQSVPCVKLLIGRGAEISLCNNSQRNALMSYLANVSTSDCVSLDMTTLLMNDMQHRDIQGRNVLHYAYDIENDICRQQVIDFLVAHGSQHVADYAGSRPGQRPVVPQYKNSDCFYDDDYYEYDDNTACMDADDVFGRGSMLDDSDDGGDEFMCSCQCERQYSGDDHGDGDDEPRRDDELQDDVNSEP